MTIAYLRQPPALTASLGALGAWVRLLGHAAEIEAGGVIAGAAAYVDRQWMIAVGLSREEVDLVVAAGLATWRGQDLHVGGYDVMAEQRVRTARKNGAGGGRPPKRNPRVNPSDNPRGNPSGTHGETTSDRSTSVRTRANGTHASPWGAPDASADDIAALERALADGLDP